MWLPEGTSDTLAVLRGLGARAVSRAVARRALSTARALGRAAHAVTHPLVPASSTLFVTALRSAPSPLAEQPDVHAFAVGAAARRALEETHVLIDADPRLGWEEGRGARLVRLAAGARVTGSKELAAAFDAALITFIDEHRVNDTSDPLEAALRVFALWTAISMVGPTRLSEAAAIGAGRTFVEHARFLIERLEDRGLVVGSHLVGELVGLYACGAALRAAGDEPAGWRQVARSGLAVASGEQILADGGGAEGSTGYARFVAELWIAALVCARSLGEEPPPGVEGVARRALGWLASTLAPDGRDVGIGDDDDSRVLPGLAEARDLASLLPLASLGPMAARLEGIGWSSEAGWLAGFAGRERWDAAPVAPWASQLASWSFGLFLARRGGLGGDMVTLRAGPHGQSNIAGHAHNDPLAMTVWFDGRPVIVDPGTGMYLGRPALRDRFRGVAAHATIAVDGAEPSPILPTRPFALPDRARAQVLAYEDTGDLWRCAGEHHGYRAQGVVHRREVRYERGARRVVVTDTLLGSGSHRIAAGFPLAAATANLDGDRVALEHASLTAGASAGDAGKALAWRLDPGLVSARYGRVKPSLVARRSGRVTLPITIVTIITAS